jgi:hypothetical protein
MEQYGTVNISLKPLIFNEFIGCFVKKKTPFPYGHGPGPRRTQTQGVWRPRQRLWRLG